MQMSKSPIISGYVKNIINLGRRPPKFWGPRRQHFEPIEIEFTFFFLFFVYKSLISIFLRSCLFFPMLLMHFLLFLLCKVHLRCIPVKFSETVSTSWDIICPICNIQQFTPSINPKKSPLEYIYVFHPPHPLFLHIFGGSPERYTIKWGGSSSLVTAKLSFWSSVKSYK